MGRIIERDINALLDRGIYVGASAAEEPTAAAPAAAAAPEVEYEDVKLPNIRKVIAKSMHASLSNMAQLTLNASFDATKIMSLRAAFKAKGEALGMNNVTLNDMVLYAVAKTLRGHRDLNANYLDDQDIMLPIRSRSTSFRLRPRRSFPMLRQVRYRPTSCAAARSPSQISARWASRALLPLSIRRRPVSSA